MQQELNLEHFYRSLDELNIEKITAALNAHWQKRDPTDPRNADSQFNPESKCAAVLMPLVQTPDGWDLLLIKRTETVADHKGQVAFPGGACEAFDRSLADTALREAMEEIGLKPADVKILGQLCDYHTVSHFRVAPIVGTFRWPYQFIPSKDEVSRIFTIPLKWLLNPENQETRSLDRLGRSFQVIYFKPYDGEILWGATARMVDNLLEILDLR